VKKILLAFLLGLIFSGCSITPRYHSFGYNVEWKTRGTSRSKTPTSARSAESHGQVARQCKDESFIKQESRATTDISSSSASNYFSLNHWHVGTQEDSRPNLSLYSLHKPTRTVRSKTSDTTPIRVVKPHTTEVLTIVEPKGIEVLDRRINISNWLIVLSNGPMIYLFWRMIRIPINDFLDFFIFFALMGLASIPILIALIHRFELGRKRRSLYYRENIQNKEAAQLLSKLYSRSVVYLFFAGNIILGLLILIEKLKMKKLLNKINSLEPNNPFILREIEKIELFYDIALVIFYLTAGLFILPYFI
jgi:hypothetical protein